MKTKHTHPQITRSILYFIAIFLIVRPLMQLLTMTLASFLSPTQETQWMDTIFLASFILMTLAVVLVVKVFEKRPLSELGLIRYQKTLSTLIRFLIYGCLMIVLALVILQGFSIYQFTSFGQPDGFYLLVTFLAFVIQGSAEELLIRGYLHHRVLEAKGYTWALAINTFFFTLPHLLSIEHIFSWEVLVIIVNLILISIIFTQAMTLTGSLWAAIGLHIGWNYSLGSIFGIAVSGLSSSKSLMNFTPNNSKIILTGGDYGLEGSALLIPFLLCLVIYLSTRIRQRKVIDHGLQQ